MIALEESDTTKAPPPAAGDGFVSILFERGDPRAGQPVAEPECFHDLNLDLVVKDITEGRADYQLERYFHLRPPDLATIRYRHEIMRDLEREPLAQACRSFSERMRAMRSRLLATETRSYPREKQRWVLDAVRVYVEAVETLRRDLQAGEPASRGLRMLRRYLAAYADSPEFRALAREAEKIAADLGAVRYCLAIRRDEVVTVRDYRGEGDYSVVIEQVFARFKQGAVKDYRVNIPAAAGLNHIEAQILDFVAELNPDVFRALRDFAEKRRFFCAGPLDTFDREVQFYLACLEYVGRLRKAGLPCCYPEVVEGGKEVRVRDGFDLALAGRMPKAQKPVVRNDFSLSGPERILVVTGPNQGGKTTFSRAFGQIHYLASLGCPVGAAEARVFLFDRIFTHFEREEDLATLHGKLQEDLVRMHRILSEATSSSIVVINEIFSSTSLEDAVRLGRKVIEHLSQMDLLAVCVTFLDELAACNEKTVSMVAETERDNPAARTYRVVRRPADGLAHALAIAEKYRVTYDCLKERLRR